MITQDVLLTDFHKQPSDNGGNLEQITLGLGLWLGGGTVILRMLQCCKIDGLITLCAS